MYEKIKAYDLPMQVELLTQYLVQIPSVNGTEGEAEIAGRIEAIIRSFPYFQEHPESVWSQPLTNDPLGRKNIFAKVSGKGASKKTIILHAHLDTVGVEDYGELEPVAYNHDELLNIFSSNEEYGVVNEHAKSGDWMFGRGALDMKSGIAVHLANLLYFSERREEWDGELVFMVNPVEENQHTGIIEAVRELLRLKEEEQLEYQLAINTDFISPLYDGDETKYIYTGAVGKLLPSFYIYGREMHVGETLKGLDPTLAASEINLRINNNMEHAENIKGELVLPPSTLYLRDHKSFYNVQTAGTCLLYLNWMVYEKSPKEIIDELKAAAIDSAKSVRQFYERQYEAFVSTNALPENKLSWEMDVWTYEEYRRHLEKKGIDVKSVAQTIMERHSNMEPRQLCYKIVDELRKKDKASKPCIIIYFAPPYCPHNFLKEDSKKNEQILHTLQSAAMKWEEKLDEKFALKRFFPYLSDSSYLSLHDTDLEIAALTENFPEWEKIYPVPVKEIKKLNVPAIDIGVYGLDAHSWRERVYKPYSFVKLPAMLQDVIFLFLE